MSRPINDRDAMLMELTCIIGLILYLVFGIAGCDPFCDWGIW